VGIDALSYTPSTPEVTNISILTTSETPDIPRSHVSPSTAASGQLYPVNTSAPSTPDSLPDWNGDKLSFETNAASWDGNVPDTDSAYGSGSDGEDSKPSSVFSL
jgi:hypothetical protein